MLFAVLWAGGMLMRTPSIDLKTVILAVISGSIVGLLIYWLYEQFSGRFR